VPAVWRPIAQGFRASDGVPVRIPLGGTGRVQIKAPQTLPDGGQTALSSVQFRLCNRPSGVTLRETTVGATGVALTLKADPNTALVGDASHVIVEAYVKAIAGNGTDPSMGHRNRVDLGVLPAIAYEIVRP
jgi:hypothetical protein